MTKQTLTKIAVFALVVILFAVAYPYLKEYASLEYIKSKQSEFKDYYEEHRALVLGGYLFLYIACTALSLPGAALLTLLAGALFGLVVGVILVSFASSIGATLAFLVARFLLGDSLQKKYGDKLEKINKGIEREGAFYLFTMRLIPAFPFFLINVLMALTKLPTLTFYWVSQLGMLAGTIVYVYAGTALSEIDSLQGILSPPIIAAFVALGVLPLISKKFIEMLRRRRGNGTSSTGE